MQNICCGGVARERWAVSLCFAAAVLLSLEALHPGSCAWMNLNNEQSFALSSILATFMAFMAMFILTRMLQGRAQDEKK